MKDLIIILRVLVTSGLLPRKLAHWLAILRSWHRCGPTFAFLAEVAAARFPHQIALKDDEGGLTFQQLREQVESFAQYLREGDEIGPGHRVVILFHNHRGFVVSLLAVARLGADVLPVNPKLSATAVETLLKSRDIDLIVHGDEVEIPEGYSTLHWSSDFRGHQPLPRTQKPGKLIVLTSGTTGVSKGIQRNPKLTELLPVTASLLSNLPLKLQRPMILAIPFYHGYGIATLALALAIGAPLITGRHYSIQPLIERLAGSEPALLVTVPTLLWRWQPQRPNLAAIITGSAPLSKELCRRLLEQIGPILYNLYGSTESGLMALATPEMLELSPGSAGKPITGNQIRIQAPPTGEIEIKGPLVLKPDPDGWRRTGDLGYFDKHGHLQICGRVDSMIVSGGENVYPHELQETLEKHPSIQEVAVIAVPDPEFSQRLAAVVVTTSELADKELKEWLSERLARHKLPKEIKFVTQLPRNELGKVKIGELRELFFT